MLVLTKCTAKQFIYACIYMCIMDIYMYIYKHTYIFIFRIQVYLDTDFQLR